MWNVNFTRPLLFHILVIARQFGTFVGLEIEINYSILTKGRSGLFWMRSLCTTRSHWADLILVIYITLPRCQDMMKTVFKTIQFETMPKYTRGLFQMRNTEIKETCYPIHQYNHLWSSLLQIYFCKPMWNKLTEDLRSLTTLNEFRTKICQISFEHQCNCYLCK